jgi:hypothetical protein
MFNARASEFHALASEMSRACTCLALDAGYTKPLLRGGDLSWAWVFMEW